MPIQTVVLGIGGGIAAYKICELASRLTQQNFEVHVVMTDAAQRFVSPLTFQALSHNPVHTSLWPQTTDEAGVAASMAHIDLATRADAILIAPATADLIARFANGLADDLLSTLVLATHAPVIIAPAMNPTMYQHPATQKNLAVLRELNYQIIEPETGRMACEHIGPGRLPANDVLFQAIKESQRATTKDALAPQSLQGKRVLITAGPTRESLDPVRFLSNRSSGKMGYAIAEEAAARGAEVVLVSGPTSLTTPHRVQRLDVVSTQEMFDAVLQHTPACDIIIAAAAPADYTVEKASARKIKKNYAGEGGELSLELIPTPDIIATAAKNKKPHQLFIGFAAETHDGPEEARRKLRDKNLDAILLNDVTQSDAGFDVETNRVTWITSSETDEWPLMSKREVAARVWDRVESFD